jgi:MFS family permease
VTGRGPEVVSHRRHHVPPRHVRTGRRTGLITLLSAEVVATLGSRVAAFAVPWLVLVTTGSPAKMGVVAAGEALPFVLSSVLGAPLIDRFGLNRTILVTMAGSAAMTAAVAVGYQAGIPVLTAIVAVNGALRGVGDRARALLLRPAVRTARVALARFTAIYDGIGKLSTLIGAPVGGVLIAVLGAPGVLWAHATSVGAAAVIMTMQARRAPAPAIQRAPEGYLAALGGGFRHMWRDRLLAGMAVMTLLTNACNAATGAVFVPLWVNEVLRSPAGLGVISGAFALGALAGNVAFTALATRLPRYLTLTIGYLVGGSPRFLVLAFSDRLPTVLVVSFLCGVAISAINPIIGVMLYQRVPPELQARVFGVSAALSYGGVPAGSLVAGWTTEQFGFTRAVVLAAGLYFSATLIPVVGHRTWRQLDELPVDGDSHKADSANSAPASPPAVRPVAQVAAQVGSVSGTPVPAAGDRR